jgi:hypothetical protein
VAFGIKTGVSVKKPRSPTGFRGTTVKPPTMRIPSQRRDYTKAAQGVENPLKGMGDQSFNPGFGQTGLTGET